MQGFGAAGPVSPYVPDAEQRVAAVGLQPRSRLSALPQCCRPQLNTVRSTSYSTESRRATLRPPIAHSSECLDN